MRIIDIFGKYAWVTPLKDKKGITIFNAFQKILQESNRKLNETWVDKGSDIYNRSMKSFLQNNNIEVYSTHNEGKSVITERIIRTLKNKIYKYKTSILKNVYIDKLDQIVNKNNNSYHRTIKMKLFDVNPSVYIDFNKEKKSYIPNWSEEFFVITKVKNTVPWTCY